MSKHRESKGASLEQKANIPFIHDRCIPGTVKWGQVHKVKYGDDKYLTQKSQTKLESPTIYANLSYIVISTGEIHE